MLWIRTRRLCMFWIRIRHYLNGSGSGFWSRSFHHAKKKTLIPTFYLWRMMKCTYLQKEIGIKTLLASWMYLTKSAGSRAGSWAESADPDPDPCQDVRDPHYWLAALGGKSLLKNWPMGNMTKAGQKGAQPIGNKSWALENDAKVLSAAKELSRKLQQVLFLWEWTPVKS